MKKITIITILSGILVMTSCNKWLDVKPQGQNTKAEMFSTEKGFRSALTGAYLHLKGGSLYGGDLMWGAVEYLAKNWDPIGGSNTFYPNLSNANYADANVRATMDNIYGGEYKVIADVNSILEYIDNRKSIFTNNNYELIKGEALALRAFAHFDVLRLFGPVPNNPGDVPILPYVKAVSTDIVLPVTFTEFTQSVLADLDAAEALLKDTDPFVLYSRSELNPSSSNPGPYVVSDDFYMYRQIRFNYHAVLALKARVYNWLAASVPDQRANAMKYAKMVIDAKDRNGVATFRLGNGADRTSGDNLMSPEHIMAVSEFRLEDIVVRSFGEDGILARAELEQNSGLPYYYISNLFPATERTSDIRWNGIWQYKTKAGQTGFLLNRKFLQQASQPVLQIPLIRLSEMYLILTECAAAKEEAEGYYTTFCAQKGIPFTTGFNASGWETDRRNKVIREYVRELYGEGQTFFTYKRYNITTLPTSWTYSYYNGNAARYIVPKPDREINYHNK